MGAKDILLRPISAQSANDFVRRVHYSGKVVNNSQLHIGVFWQGVLHGAMQFGPSLDKRKMLGLVSGTLWHEFIELNRMALDDVLPRNSESRALAVAMRLLREHAPQLKWVITFADGVQCGDGTIYRAAGFSLIGVRAGEAILRLPSGEVCHRIALHTNHKLVAAMGGKMASVPKMAEFLNAEVMPGHMMRYIYFLDPSCKDRLTVPILPYSAIEKAGAGMYRGKSRAGVVQSAEHELQFETALQGDPPALLSTEISTNG